MNYEDFKGAKFSLWKVVDYYLKLDSFQRDIFIDLLDKISESYKNNLSNDRLLKVDDNIDLWVLSIRNHSAKLMNNDLLCTYNLEDKVDNLVFIKLNYLDFLFDENLIGKVEFEKEFEEKFLEDYCKFFLINKKSWKPKFDYPRFKKEGLKYDLEHKTTFFSKMLVNAEKAYWVDRIIKDASFLFYWKADLFAIYYKNDHLKTLLELFKSYNFNDNLVCWNLIFNKANNTLFYNWQSVKISSQRNIVFLNLLFWDYILKKEWVPRDCIYDEINRVSEGNKITIFNLKDIKSNILNDYLVKRLGINKWLADEIIISNWNKYCLNNPFI